MRHNSSDITRTVISPDYINDHIYSLFPDSVFLDRSFRILGVSLNICRSLEYSTEELRGKSISQLEASGALESLLRNRLRAGSFKDEIVKLTKKSGAKSTYTLSAFYLGILTECCGDIVLRLINRDEIEEIHNNLTQTKIQVDHFIYRTAHDLRGPLATIQGLVNLLKIRTDDSEVDRFVHLIETHSKRLDERLRQLVYLAKSEDDEQPEYRFAVTELETHLRKAIERNAFVDFLELFVSSDKNFITGYNEIHLRSILTNVILYILSLPKQNTDSFIRVNVRDSHGLLTVKVSSAGFETDVEMEKSLRDINTSMYVDLLRSSRFIYLFAAQKLALQAHALITVDFLTPDTQQLSISLSKK